MSRIHGLDNRLAVNWPPILAAADDLVGDGDATALGGALGRLLAAIPDEVLERHLATRDAGCPVGECGHPGPSHEPDDHAADGTPVRPICCAQTGGKPCPCGNQWRNT